MPTFRAARSEDHPLFARLYEALETNDPPITEAAFETMRPDCFLLVDDAGAELGLAVMNLLDGVGYVRQVIIDAPHRGHGYGRVLMEESARRCRAAGIHRWALNVKPGNTPAVALYRSMGFEVAHASVTVRFGWDVVDALPQSDAVVREVTKHEDPALERRFALPGGRITQQRVRPDVIVFTVDGEHGGLAVFDPHFPGAFPFAVPHVETAAALLRQMRPHRQTKHDYVQVVLEDAEVVAAALEAAGAQRHLSFLHMTGNVPGA